MHSYPSIVVLLITFLALSLAQHGEKLPKDQFDKCVAECGQQLEECTQTIRTLWTNFSKNRQKIVKVINRCCLQGQSDHSSPSTASFAACVRNNCNAQLWGCNIKKRHSGFLSKEEQEFILEKERRDKLKESATEN